MKSGKLALNIKSKLRSRLKALNRVDFPSLITISISKSAIINNIKEFQKIAPNGRVAPVLKSNAYGHGLTNIADILADDSSKTIPFLVIDSYFEARALRDHGIRTPLLVIGYSTAEMILKNQFKDIRFTIGSIEMLKKISKPTSIHLKIDTGMHRQGILPDETNEAIKILKNAPFIQLEGICSHFSDAENTETDFTDSQIVTWNIMVKKFRNEFPSLRYWHVSNTAGNAHTPKIQANLSRLGLGLYGYTEKSLGLNLQPALEMKTVISGIKKIRKGASVGYSRTFVAPHDMTIATIPVGYFEGVDRRLSNKGYVRVIGHSVQFAPIIGKVSMNITTIDITNIVKNDEMISEGDSVTVISANLQEANSIEQVAKTCQTIPYEILIHIPGHLKRDTVGILLR